MPQLNAWIGGHAGFDPLGGRLEGVRRAGHRAVAASVKAGRDYGAEHMPSAQAAKLADYPHPRLYVDDEGNAKWMHPRAYKKRRNDYWSKRRMPYRRGYRTSIKRRRASRYKRRVRRARPSFPRELWPRQKLVRLKSTISGAIYTSAGAWDGTNGIAIFKANSLNDPWAGESSALPLGTDQLANLYQKYVVVASTLVIDCHPSSITGGGRVGLALRNSNTSLASADYYSELPLQQNKIASGDVDLVRLAMRYKAKRFWRVKKFMDAEDQQGAFSTTPGDPTDVAYWHFWCQDLNANEAITVEYRATMVFDILLFDPIIPARSDLA